MYMQIYLDFGFFLSYDILPVEGPLCVVEDEVGVRVRVASDGGRLEQLADAAGRVDVVLHRYNEFFSKLKKAKYVHANIPGLRLLFELRLPSQREAEQFVLQVAFVGVW